ncbi:MAG: zinc-binding alcohol dehydrogenase [Spirochaetales bacterium]|nr:zinc-binding alcohol dehydrogenase [Spirochaetales bacterium]
MTNKKIMFPSEGQVEVWTEEFESKPTEDEIVIKTQYSIISSGTELACLAGLESSWAAFPFNPGYSAVGTVEEKGSGISDFEVGDTVFFYGAHSAYSVINPDKTLCVKVSDGIRGEHVPFLRIATIAMAALRISDIELGDFVAVVGQGMVGNLAAQLASLQGGEVVAFDLDAQRLEQSRSCGIRHTESFDHKDLTAVVKSITHGAMFSTFIEATGISKVAEKGLELIGQNGELVLLGTPRAEHSTDLTPALRKVHLRSTNVAIKGAHEWVYPVKEIPFAKHSFVRNTKIAMNLIRDGKLKIEPLLSHVVKPEGAKEAYEGLRTKTGGYTGVVVDWND